MTRTVACVDMPIPSYEQLTADQVAGRACVACGGQLADDAVLAGFATGREGPYPMTVNAWACPPPAVGQ
ncbi:hypothetical protein ACFVGY_21485 [Streptomyces sp. NPDC127106]|uniref:hypothetical protein n=1 Tax=Streptomyces sp. NPDC127106 TaxID=3345360 RepID=UPI003643EA3A